MKKKYSKYLFIKLGIAFSTSLSSLSTLTAQSEDPLESVFWPIDGDIPTPPSKAVFRPTFSEVEPFEPLNTPIIPLQSLEKDLPSSPNTLSTPSSLNSTENSPTPQTTTNIFPETIPTVQFPAPIQSKTITINYNNVSIIEFIRFISRISNKNFVFDENDLQFNVTIVSEEETSIENILTALIQELRIHDLQLIEQGNNLIIHKNKGVNAISKVMSGEVLNPSTASNEVVTQVFRLNSSDAEKVAAIIKPLISENSILDVLKETNHIVVTDLTSNVAEISKLIKNLDAPRSGMVIGQYVVRSGSIDTLINMTEQIMQPIANDQPLLFVPHRLRTVFLSSPPLTL